MKIAYLTNLRAPYRTLQLNEFAKIKEVDLTVYYTDKPNENRKWNLNQPEGILEVDLKGYKIAGKFGYLNSGLSKIIKTHDLIILGCYEQPTYILMSLLCRLFHKPYVLSYDGISANRLTIQEQPLKKFLKKIVIDHAAYIMGNGKVSQRYFHEVFEYPLNRIYNQYLTVDSHLITTLANSKVEFRKTYRERLKIKDTDKVLIYSGRLIDIKNVETVIQAISHLNCHDLVFLITGSGELEQQLVNVSNQLGVRTIITGFISEQEELFKHYFVGDALILPSIVEPWGLVVNEAMLAGLPILVSQNCGCSLDLVQEGENGYLIDPTNVEDIAKKIKKLLYDNDLNQFSKASLDIIQPWNFENSRRQLEGILNRL